MSIGPFVFNITLTICSFLFYLFLIIVYFRKNAKYNIKNYIFRRILIIGIFGFLFEFLYFFMIHYSNHTLLIGLTRRFTILCFLATLLLWIYYVFILVFEKNSKASLFIRENHFNIDLYLILAITTICLIDVFLPVSFVYGERDLVSSITGSGIIFIIVLSFVFSLLPVPLIISGFREISHKRLLSYYVIFFFIVITIIFNLIYPTIHLLPLMFTLSCYLIYYRLENPDLLYIRKYKKNNERMRTLREKYGFLFNMSPELRELLNEVSFMKDNYLLDGKKPVNIKKLESLLRDFIKSSEDGKTTLTNIDDDGIEILDFEEEIPDEMLVTKEIYSLDELKEVLKEDNLPKW